MSDTPKKPARKKNPPKAEADAPKAKARAGAGAQTNKVNDQQMREAVLARVRDGDVVITMGAGSIANLAPELAIPAPGALAAVRS